jgi:outer membrane receptor for ferrienterochelin and colicin
MKNLLFVIILFVSCLSYGQNCSVRGKLFDKKTGEILPFANVSVEGTNTGCTSDEKGLFLFEDLKPGFVRLIASFVGYKDTYSSQIKLGVGREVYIEISLMPSMNTLQDVEIVAAPFRKVLESPLSMRRIGIADIENSPGGNRDISVVVQSFPGIRPSTSFRNDVIVRGGGPSENVFVLDGIEIPVINHFATQGASGGSTGIMNIDFIDEVKMYTGAFPSKYGNVMSSVMDITMSKANRKEIQYKFSVGASEASISANGPISEKSSFIFSVRQSYLQFLFKALKLPFLPTYNDVQFKYDYDISNHLKFSVFGIGSLDKLRLNTDTNGLSESRLSLIDFLPESDQFSYSTGAFLKYTKNKTIKTLKIGSSLLGNSSNKYFKNDRSAASNLIMDYSSKEYRTSIIFDDLVFIGDSKLNFGIEYKFHKIVGDNYMKLFINNKERELIYDKRFSLNNYAFYSQYSSSVFDERLDYSVGARLDYADINKNTKNVFKHISPRVSLSYHVSENWNINGNTGIYYSLPELLSYSHNDNGVFKNLDLPYITCTHWVGGLEYNPSSLIRFTLEYFNKKYSDYPLSVDNGVSLANLGGGYGVVGDEALVPTSKGLAQGVEFMARYQSKGGLNLLMSYTYVKSEFSDVNDNYIPSSWDNRHLFTFTGSQKFKHDWSVGVKWRFVGGGPYTPYDVATSSLKNAWDVISAARVDYSRYNELRRDDFHQLDIRVDKTFLFDGWSLEYYADIQNVYNFKSEGQNILIQEKDANGNGIITNPDAPLEQQRYKLKSIENIAGSILPTFGLIIEF